MNYHKRNETIARHEDDALNEHLKERYFCQSCGEQMDSSDDPLCERCHRECSMCGDPKDRDAEYCEDCSTALREEPL